MEQNRNKDGESGCETNIMRETRILLACIFLLGLMTTTAFAQKKSLFDRLGGKPAIVAVVDEFAARCLTDTRINKKFGKSDPARLKAMLVDQICSASGGPCQYQGRDMKSAHKSMGVTDGEFSALVENLAGALDKLKVQAADKNELLGLLAPMKTDIVEVNSKETGTALPKEFKPAPSLKSLRMRPNN